MQRNRPPKVLPHIKRVHVKGKDYLYFNTGRKKPNGATIYAPLPEIDSREFPGRYAALCAGRTKRGQADNLLTVPDLWHLFEKSPQFKAHRASTQRVYTLALERLCTLLPTAPAQGIQGTHLRRLLDNMADKPGMANMVLKATGSMWQWGRKRGHVTNEPTRGLEQFEVGEHKAWSEDALQAGLSAADASVRLAVHMLYYTDQRIGDVSRALWSDLRKPRWDMVQEKTNTPLSIPIHSALRVELERHKPTGPFLFTGRRGAPLTSTALSQRIVKVMKEAGFKVRPHGLRKNGVNALLHAGCSTGEVSAISGQSLAMVELYAKERDQPGMATAAVIKWERKA